MSKLFYFKDIEDGLDDYLSILEADNAKLYQFIYQHLKDNTSVGISEDMIAFLCDNSEEIKGKVEYLDMISTFAFNIVFTVEHMRFVIDYFQNDIISTENRLDTEDFYMILTEAIEKNIAIERIKEIFLSGKNVYDIYAEIDNYRDENLTSMVTDDVSMEEEQHTDTEISNSERMSITNHEQDIVSQPKDVPFSDMFQSIVSVVTYNNKNDDSIGEFKNRSEGINSVITKASSDLAVCLTEMLGEMQNDKTTIARLEFLLSIQQKAFSTQQLKLNEARNEISRLNLIIKENEEAELNRRAIEQKIAELSNLSGSNKLSRI